MLMLLLLLGWLMLIWGVEWFGRLIVMARILILALPLFVTAAFAFVLGRRRRRLLLVFRRLLLVF